MKNRKLLVAVSLFMIAVISGCDKNNKEQTEEVYVTQEDMIMPDSETVKSEQNSSTAQRIIDNVENKVEDNTEEVEKLNEECVNTDEDVEAINSAIRSKLESNGVSNSFTIANTEYIDTDTYLVTAYVDDSTLVVQVTVNENTNTVEAETCGSINGSSYGGLIGISKINDMDISTVEDELFNISVYNICTVLEKRSDGYVISDGNFNYLVHRNNGAIKAEIISE